MPRITYSRDGRIVVLETVIILRFVLILILVHALSFCVLFVLRVGGVVPLVGLFAGHIGNWFVRICPSVSARPSLIEVSSTHESHISFPLSPRAFLSAFNSFLAYVSLRSGIVIRRYLSGLGVALAGTPSGYRLCSILKKSSGVSPPVLHCSVRNDRR